MKNHSHVPPRVRSLLQAVQKPFCWTRKGGEPQPPMHCGGPSRPPIWLHGDARRSEGVGVGWATVSAWAIGPHGCVSSLPPARHGARRDLAVGRLTDVNLLFVWHAIRARPARRPDPRPGGAQRGPPLKPATEARHGELSLGGVSTCHNVCHQSQCPASGGTPIEICWATERFSRQ